MDVMENERLRERFLRSSWILTFILAGSGINLITPNRKRMFWVILLLLVDVQCDFFVFIKRAASSLVSLFLNTSSRHFMDDFIIVIYRLKYFIDTFNHFLLVFTLRPLLNSIWNELEQLDDQLGRPDLNRIRRYAIVAAFWLTFTVMGYISLNIFKLIKIFNFFSNFEESRR